jgi:hypothetical protein
MATFIESESFGIPSLLSFALTMSEAKRRKWNILSKYHKCTFLGCNTNPKTNDYRMAEWMTGVQSPTGAKDFSSSFCIKTGSVATQPPIK